MIDLNLMKDGKHHAVPLPIAAQASRQWQAQAELIRSIWAYQDDDGDITSARHRGAIAATIPMPCRSFADVAVKLAVAMHELSPCTDKGDASLAFDPGDLPTVNAAPLLAAALNDLLELIQPGDDSAIIEAWDRWCQAHTKWLAEPDDPPHDAGGLNAAQRELCEIMADAEAVILSAPAKTLRGLEMQILCSAGLCSHYITNDDYAAAKAHDLAGLTESLGNWNVVVIAIRSLRSMQETGR